MVPNNSAFSSSFALVTPDAGSQNPMMGPSTQTPTVRFAGRVPLNPAERFPSYGLFASEPMMGAAQPGAALPGKACNVDASFPTLQGAKEACLASACCGGVTQTRSNGAYSLRAGRTPVQGAARGGSASGATSWVKETAHGRTTDAGEAADEQLKSLQTTTLLSKAYFSPANQEILQNAIRKGVHDATEQVVDKQDYLQLQIVMRSVFLQYAKHDTSSAAAIRAQIAELNAKVVAYCVPIVTSNVKQYLHYRKDVSTLPEPMAYGLATSQAGSRSLEMKPFV